MTPAAELVGDDVRIFLSREDALLLERLLYQVHWGTLTPGSAMAYRLGSALTGVREHLVPGGPDDMRNLVEFLEDGRVRLVEEDDR